MTHVPSSYSPIPDTSIQLYSLFCKLVKIPILNEATNVPFFRFVLWWGVEARLAVFQPELIKEILSTEHRYSYGKSHLQQKGNQDFIGKGLLMVNEEAWAHQRRIVAPAFHTEKLKVIRAVTFIWSSAMAAG